METGRLQKSSFEVFCASSIARIDDFKTLSRNRKTETLKSGQDKGHRREMEVTIAAMTQGEDAPISFAELMEATESTFAIEEAIRTGKWVTIDA
jgi:vesicle coat complex subunit